MFLPQPWSGTSRVSGRSMERGNRGKHSESESHACWQRACNRCCRSTHIFAASAHSCGGRMRGPEGARRDSLKRLLVRSIERDIPIRHLHPILCRGRQFFETPSRAFRATVPPDPPVPSRPGPAAGAILAVTQNQQPRSTVEEENTLAVRSSLTLVVGKAGSTQRAFRGIRQNSGLVGRNFSGGHSGMALSRS